MLLAVFIFSTNDVLGKWLAGTYGAPQILLMRSAVAMAILVVIFSRIGFAPVFTMERPGLQIVRAFLGAAETGVFYAAVRYLPLADAMTFYLAGPIYVTILAALFLRERVGWRRWSAVIAGFVGVVIALGPTAGSFGWATLIPLGGSIVYAVFLTVTRSLRGTSDTVMAFWQIAASLVLGGIAAPFTWTPATHAFDFLLLGLLGVGALVAIVGINRSLKLAPASVVVPYQYTMIIWAGLFGYFVFGDVPRWQTILGAAIIIAAGLFIFFREQKLARPTAQPELPPEI
ncbi:MAG: DMT family transporter [Rhizobiales bacterium]|nr:DMT family transporter [Hyphomicrobiales bacterium]